LLPPPHVTVLLFPVWRVQPLVPVHVAVQFELQLPTHSDCPPHVVLQPVPHVELHVFFESQLYVTLFGAPASAPLSEAVLGADPKVQVPPALQVHVLPEHSQSPVHAACCDEGGASELPPHAVALRAIPNASPRKPRRSLREVSMLQGYSVIPRAEEVTAPVAQVGESPTGLAGSYRC
jgi:hypothetical protein